MIGKKDTVAIFESYQNYLKEQDEKEMGLNQIIDALLISIQKDSTKSIQIKDLNKLVQFLGQPEMLEAYKSFRVKLTDTKAPSSESDASAANMGEGGVLEVQPSGEYPKGE